MSTSTDYGMLVASTSSGTEVALEVHQRVRRGLPDEHHGDVDRDLLAAADDHQVGVLDEAA